MLCFLGFFVFGVLARHWLNTHDEMERPLREAAETADRRWRSYEDTADTCRDNDVGSLP